MIIHVLLIVWCEIVDQRSAGSDLQETIAVLKSPEIGIENTISSDKIDVPGWVCSQAITALPYTRSLASSTAPNPVVIGLVLKTISCWSVLASYPRIQPWYGLTSPWAPKGIYTTPLSSSSAARWFWCRYWKAISPFMEPAPFPGELARSHLDCPDFQLQ